MDKILNVKNLKISFRTQSGTLKAVRDISFDLERGRTLAIVGESGSGKSVTSKAILGILAGNSIVEGGEILYDGRDLLKISEEEMCTIRGDKISMIFQDPLSALNPIVKIGKQITEAMLLKNKTSRKQAKDEFNSTLALLNTNIAEATGDAAKAKELCEMFDKFCIEANKLENSYNISSSNALNVKEEIIDFIFRTGKAQKLDIKNSLNTYSKLLKEIKDPFFTAGYTDQLTSLSNQLNSVKGNFDKKTGVVGNDLISCLEEIKTLLEEMLSQTRPDFFCIGFYSMKNPSETLTGRNVAELNAMASSYLEEHFMDSFVPAAAKGIEHSYRKSLEKKSEVLSVLNEAKVYFSGEFDKKSSLDYAKKVADAVDATIDRLEIQKDSQAYTLRSSLNTAINKYFTAVINNPKEEERFEKQTAKRDALIAKGKTVDWKVIPKNVYDLDELKNNIVTLIARMISHYQNQLHAGDVDFTHKAHLMIDYFKDKASKVVYEVTPSMAKERAIKLMEEVGINEPRMRYYQYPFEFSGGMRQRIVIAIALAADPEILICDEPTTALDVTIQAQILELINRLKKERNLSIIFITHDLGVVANMADDIGVMYAGKIVEYGTADDIFYDPRHPYTWALLSSMPDLDTKEKLDAIPGTPPNMIFPPVGDAFADRNKYAMQIDFEMQPPMFEISETHRAATWLLHPDAPKVEVPKAITDRIERMKQKSGGAAS
ncbi:MAG: ATP-binding cassette domain-containing protein [Erysipelotrichaceae bacterium]|nr:ATP-binding cassette domain-containing protein [Erysipelotrichaceae bacterium]